MNFILNKKEEDCFTAPLPANLKQPTKEIDNFITVNCEW